MNFETYRDRKQQWRWRLVADNGKTVADSGQGYKRRRARDRAIELVKQRAATAPVIEAS